MKNDKYHIVRTVPKSNSLEIRLSNLLARKLQNQNIYKDSIEKFWQKSLVRINFHWPWATGPLLKSMTDLIDKFVETEAEIDTLSTYIQEEISQLFLLLIRHPYKVDTLENL